MLADFRAAHMDTKISIIGKVAEKSDKLIRLYQLDEQKNKKGNKEVMNKNMLYRSIPKVDVLLEDPEIQIVIEVMGGIEPARTYITEALHAGKQFIYTDF